MGMVPLKAIRATLRPKLAGFARSSVVLSVLLLLLAAGPSMASDAAVAGGQTPRPVLTYGSFGGVKWAIEFSPDGRFALLIGEGDLTLIDRKSKRQLRKIPLRVGNVSAKFSADGQSILTAGHDDGVLREYATATGDLLRETRTPLPIQGIQFLPDRRAALVIGNGALRRLDVETGALTRTGPPAIPYGGFALAPDGLRVALVAGDAVAFLDPTSFEKRGQLSGATGITQIKFSGDGRRLLGIGFRQLVVWDIASGQRLLDLKFPLSEQLDAIALADDGASVLIATYDTSHGEAFQIVRRDVLTGRELWRVPLESQAEFLEMVPGGSQFVTAYLGARPKAIIGDMSSGKFDALYSIHANLTNVTVSADGTWAAISAGPGARLWDGRTGREARQIEGPVGELKISANGRRILGADAQSGVPKVWDTRSGKALAELRAVEESVQDLSPSGEQALTLMFSGEKMHLWDAASGRQLRELGDGHDLIRNAVYCRNGTMILSGGVELALWDAASGRKLRSLRHAPEDKSGVRIDPLTFDKVACSADGRRIVTFVEGTDEILVLDGNSGAELTHFKEGAPRGWQRGTWVTALAISPDGNQILTGDFVGAARRWDASTGRQLSDFSGHTSDVVYVGFHATSGLIYSASDDGTLRVWNPDSSQELVQLATFDDGGWAISDLDGRFDAPNGGRNAWLYWVAGLRMVELEQLKERYYEPGLLAKKLGLSEDPLRDVEAFSSFAPPPDVQVKTPTAAQKILHVDLANQEGGIGKVIVRVNGKQVEADARPQGQGRVNAAKVAIDLPIEKYRNLLQPGKQNQIEVIAYNGDNQISSRGEVVNIEAPEDTSPPPEFWAIVVGVSKYANDALKLNFPSRDAELMADALRRGSSRLFGPDHAHVRLIASGQAASALPSKQNIRAAFDELQQHAHAGDVVVVYLSGHGTSYRDTYFFPTQDAVTLEMRDQAVLDQAAVSSRELADWMAKTPANKQVLLLDTCAAGAAQKSFSTRGPSTDLQRAIERVKDNSGTFVLMGAAADRVSYEAGEYGQGLLTYALLEGMAGASVHDGGLVDVVPLLHRAQDRVPELAKDIGGIQAPIIAQPSAFAGSFDIAKITAEDQAAIPLRQPRPRIVQPRLTNRDSSDLDDDLGLEDQLSIRLRDASAQVKGDIKGGPAIVFVDVKEMVGALKPKGTYKVGGSKLHVDFELYRGSAALAHSAVECSAQQLETCADLLAKEIVVQAAAVKAQGQ